MMLYAWLIAIVATSGPLVEENCTRVESFPCGWQSSLAPDFAREPVCSQLNKRAACCYVSAQEEEPAKEEPKNEGVPLLKPGNPLFDKTDSVPVLPAKRAASAR